jgi:hypothetical protein
VSAITAAVPSRSYPDLLPKKSGSFAIDFALQKKNFWPYKEKSGKQKKTVRVRKFGLYIFCINMHK